MATCDLREMSDVNADLTESLEMLKNFEMRVNNHGSLTMLAAIRRASSRVMRLAAVRMLSSRCSRADQLNNALSGKPSNELKN
jgi:hypothetical protein